MKQEDYNEMVKQFEMPGDPPGRDSVIVKGLTPNFSKREKDLFKKRLDELWYQVIGVIDPLQERNEEHMRVIGELLRQNQALKDKLKELEK
jgi:hypothetical protein